jgi:hypothetical protein
MNQVRLLLIAALLLAAPISRAQETPKPTSVALFGMTRPVCMNSTIHSVLFAPDTLDFWVANADSKYVASHTRYTHYNLKELLAGAAEDKRAGGEGQ